VLGDALPLRSRMDAIDTALLEAFNRVIPKLRADPREAARRLARTRRPTLTRPVRPWCLCLRASDTRLTALGASSFDVDDAREAHPVTLGAEALRRLCAPVHIDWPGIDWKLAADRLGRPHESINQWLDAGVFNVRRDPASCFGRRGRPIPVVWSPHSLDPAAPCAERPDPIWGSLWQSLARNIPDDFECTLTRIPHAQPFKGRQCNRGWLFQCPGLLTPLPLMRTMPDPWTPELSEREAPDSATSAPATPTTPRIIIINDRLHLHTPCTRHCRLLYMPMPPWTLPKAIAPELAIDVEGLAGQWHPAHHDPIRHRRTFACARCWRIRHVSLVNDQGWNTFVSHITAGLLYAREVPRPLADAPRTRKRPFKPRVPYAIDRRRRIQALLLQGLSYPQIAARIGCSVPGVNYHVVRIYKQHAVHTRAALATALGHPPIPRPSPKRDEVARLLLRGCTTKQIATLTRSTPKSVSSLIEKLFKIHHVHSRPALIAALTAAGIEQTSTNQTPIATPAPHLRAPIPSTAAPPHQQSPSATSAAPSRARRAQSR